MISSRLLPADRIPELYIPDGVVNDPFAAGHYSIAGNEWVAQTLYRKLASIPTTASAMGKLAEPVRATSAVGGDPKPVGSLGSTTGLVSK